MKLASNIDKASRPAVKQGAIYWDVMHSPLGEIYAAVDPVGSLKLLIYGAPLERSMVKISSLGQPVQDREQLTHVFGQLEEYFNGHRKQFDLLVDLGELTSFQQNVLETTQKIPHGEVASYKTIATIIKKPGAARAVGGALASNPVGIVVPCHRVVAADGSLGGFSGVGGLVTKRFLLDLESGRLL